MNLFSVSIITPVGEQSFQVEWLEIKTPSGSRIIKAGHAPLIALLVPDSTILFLKPGGAVESSIITQGVVRVERTRVLIVADQP